jgi:molybdopterin-guanine dinucleotide biosynthesis protein A
VLGGRPLLAIALEHLNAACAATAVSAAAGSQAEALATGWEVPVLHDPPGAPRGPLAGLCAGLDWAQARGAPLLAVLPCDLPFVPTELFDRLVEALRDDDGAAVARTADGLQSLCLVARTGLHAALADVLAAGGHPPVHEWLAGVGARAVAFADAGAFANINTPADLARAASS